MLVTRVEEVFAASTQGAATDQEFNGNVFLETGKPAMHPLVWISTEVNRGRWGFVRLHRDIGKQQKHLRSEPSRCYLQVFCICTSRFKGNVCHPNADRIPRHRSCRCNRMHARSLVLCTKSHGKGCRHDCLVDGKSIVHETTDTRVLGRLRS